VASEIREILDTVRDTESARTYPYLVPALAELLRSGEPAFSKDTSEYAFRRVLLEILNRLPVSESLRSHMPTIFSCMLHVIRHDNEENGTTACKALVDIIRGYRILTEENLNEFVAIFLQVFQNMKGLVEEVLSEDSSNIDTTVLFPSIRSFKVLGEMGMVIVIMSQVHRQLVSPAMQTSIPYATDVLALESPAQHKARTDYEAMGEVWSGMSSTVKNAGAYSEFIHSQIKACTHLLGLTHIINSCVDAILPRL
jgi:transformation/transcription domain-associated protein